MEIRVYRKEDIREIVELFYHTVHTVNREDYSQEQLDAWADGSPDLESWDRSFQEHISLVAVTAGADGENVCASGGQQPGKQTGGERIVGFADIDSTGYLDRLYVHRDFQRQGIAEALCDRLEQASGAERITTHASITARPFFEKRGYRVIREQQVERKGILLTNYVMEKPRI